MESTTSSDGRVTFTLAPEDDYSGRILLPNGTELKMPALDLEIMMDFYLARLNHIREHAKRRRER